MNFIKLVKRYKINSIFVKSFIVSFIVFLVPMIVISGILYSYYSEKTTNQSNEIAASELSYVANNFDKLFKWIDSNVDYLPNENYVSAFLLDTYNKKNVSETVLTTNLVKSQINKIMMVEPCIKSVYIYSFVSNYVLSTDGSGDLNKFHDTVIKDTIKKLLESPNKKGFYVYQDNNSLKIISLFMILNLNGQDAGLICVNIDYSKLQYLLSEKLTINHNVKIFDYKGSEFLSINDTNNIPCVTQKLVSENSEYEYISNFPIKETGNIGLSILLILISLIFSFFAGIIITYKTCMPIGNLIDIMNSPYDWVSEKISRNLFGEIRLVLENYTSQIYYTHDVEEKLSIRLEELKQAQLDALGMQINPHFLFNTLQIISLSATKLTSSRNEAVVATELLSKILKYNLYSKENTGIVENEIEYTRAYVELQKIRYKNRVNVVFEVDNDVLKKITAKLIMQPLVENAYSHGIIPNKKTGTIHIKVYAKENLLYMEIIDNGIGLTLEKIDDLYKNMNNINIKKGESIGVNNVNKRIQLLFGEDYGIEIDREYINGARFIIKQPLQ